MSTDKKDEAVWVFGPADQGRVRNLVVESAEEATVVYLTISGADYQRNSPDSWSVLMGEAWEPVWDCEDLERAYQEWLCLNPKNAKR